MTQFENEQLINVLCFQFWGFPRIIWPASSESVLIKNNANDLLAIA